MSKISCVADGGRVVAVGTLEQIKADAEEWTVVRDTHEAIISRQRHPLTVPGF